MLDRDKWILVVTSLILFSSFKIGLAQPNYTLASYSGKQGLSHNSVSSILKDEDGFMWMATWDGLNRFDGTSFRTFKKGDDRKVGLKSQRMIQLIDGKDDRIWILTYDKQVYWFDKKTELFHGVSSQINATENRNIYFNRIFYADSVHLWATSENDGLFLIPTNGDYKDLKVFTGKSAQGSTAINVIYKESAVSRWVGTNHGLFRLQWNGETWIEQTVNLKNHGETEINKIVGNQTGIYVLVDGHSIFFKAKNETYFTAGLRDVPVNDIYLSKTTQNLMCTTADGNILSFDSMKRKTSVLYSGARALRKMFEDSHGNLWVETLNGGVLKYDIKNNNSLLISSPYYHPNSATVFSAFEDPNHTVWLAMGGGGFGYFDRKREEFQFTIEGLENDSLLLPQHVYGVYYDRNGVAWFSTENQGFTKLVMGDDRFKRIKTARNSASMWGDEVRALIVDHRGSLWTGTKKGDLSRYYQEELRPVNFVNYPKEGLGSIYSLFEDKNYNIWIGTKGRGIYKAIPLGGGGSSYKLEHYDRDSSGLEGLQVYSIFQDVDGRMWVGTFDGGLFGSRMRKGQIKFEKIDILGYNENAKLFGKIRHLTNDRQGNLWIATTNGLVIYDRKKRAKVIRDGQQHDDLLGDNDLQFIYAGKHGEMWVCSGGGGLIKIQGDPFGKLTFERYTTASGLCNDFVLSCLEKSEGDLWVTTEGGLSRLDIDRSKFVNLDVNDGFQGIGFAEKSMASSPSGKLFWGTSTGVLTFNQNVDIVKAKEPKIVISNFKVNNEEWPGKKAKEGYSNVQYVQRLDLSYDQNNLIFDVAITDYRYAHHNISFRLMGLDSVWRQNGAVSRISFTNLNPGKYVLEVKSESDLYDGELIKQLNIVISPPWWNMWWAYLGYFMLICVFSFLAYRFLRTIIGLKNKIAVQRKLAEVKMEFFTKVSHELRTPLTLIKTPAERLLENPVLGKKERSYMRLITNNAERLERFVNQLLDVRKIQQDKFDLDISEFDIVGWLENEVIGVFDQLARERKITIRFISDAPFLIVQADKQKLEVVVNNLLSNALKYTRENSLVVLRVKINAVSSDLVLIIEDDGPGVPEESLKKIFDLFYTVPSLEPIFGERSGIGLALVKELVELHQGRINALNKDRGGLQISIVLPAAIVEQKNKNVVNPTANTTLKVLNEGDDTGRSINQKNKSSDEFKLKVLLVEDNKDLQFFLVEELTSRYRVFVASDGEEGWTSIEKYHPDIIISDIMMPKRNGIDLLRSVRAQVETSHLPFILLSAKHAIQNQIEGLRYGADYYITKPFDMNFLIASVDNLLEKRQQLFGRLKGDIKDLLVPEEALMTHQDEDFLKKVVCVTDKFLNDSEFNVDKLASHVSMGRNTFYRKFRSLTNQTPVEFLRDMRLKKAKSYLRGGKDNISEVAYLVGFNDPKYFGKCFKAKYGVNPKEFSSMQVGQ